MTHEDIIARIGGLHALAKAIGVDQRRTVHWRERGIPARYWPVLEASRLGQQYGITTRQLMRTSPLVQQQ